MATGAVRVFDVPNQVSLTTATPLAGEGLFISLDGLTYDSYPFGRGRPISLDGLTYDSYPFGRGRPIH